MAIAPIYVAAPTVAPAKYGLLDTVPPTKGTERIGMGVEYQPDFCGPARAFTPPCDPPGTKVAEDGLLTVIGEPVPIYHLFQCRLVGSDDIEGRARRSLDLGASRAVEQGFWEVMGTGATDVTGGTGTPLDVVVGLAALEDYAGDNYGGRAVIHMTRGMAVRLVARGAIERVGDHLETGVGSLVVAGAGYGGGSLPSAPAAGADWMFATGAVSIWEDKTIVSGVVQKVPYDNEFNALAERMYVPTYECFNAAVEVTQEA
jgi:hypothetical protein